jgi:hypothetical protein
MADLTSRVEISVDDAQRLNRLSEEVNGRLTEIALIISRLTGGTYTGGPIRSFSPRQPAPVGAAEAAAAATSDWLEIVEILPGFECCYGSIGGETVLACPCS